MNPQEAHVFVVDDEPAILTAFQRALESAGMQVSVFSRAEDSLAALSQQPCDVIVTDMRMGSMDGLTLVQEVRRRFPWLRIIVITAYGDIPLTVTAMKAGAADFLEKPVDRQELLSAVKNALKGALQPVSVPREALSPMEAQVLRLFLEGRTSREIGTILNRAARTIEAHRYCLLRKFGVHNAVQLAQKASALWSDGGLASLTGTVDRRTGKRAEAEPRQPPSERRDAADGPSAETEAAPNPTGAASRAGDDR